MASANVLDQMAKFDFKSPVKITLLFEDSDDDLEIVNENHQEGNFETDSNKQDNTTLEENSRTKNLQIETESQQNSKDSNETLLKQLMNATLKDLLNKTCRTGNQSKENELDKTMPNLQIEFWSPLIYAGCWAATLSTALTNLLSVPRLIQALGLDRVYPGLIFFSKRYGKHGEPYRGYVLVFCVSVSFLLIADLNMIAPLITNFYLASYALINFCTFHAAFFKPISWRPRFRFFNTWLSLGGFVLCLAIMMVISWVMALLTTFIFITLYLLVLYRKPEASWGSSTEAQRYQETITSILNISHRTANIKSFLAKAFCLIHLCKGV